MQSQMKYWLAVVAWMLVTPAHAASQPSWDGLAASFGCTFKENEQHAPDDSFYMAQYIPQGESKTNWTRIFTVQLFRAPAETEPSNQYLANLISQIPKNIEATKGGDVTVWQSNEGKDGPVAYGEFYLAGEHTVTVVYRAAKGVVAVNQFAVRKTRLTREEKQQLAQLIGASIKPPANDNDAPEESPSPSYPTMHR